ncbi:MAG: HAMP domain-containing histidine kinase [Calothrix sp. SM1_5_4]|nr:HAMP domain-containing histidine kinase [Calothrix sp. SM1_5_4]
MKLGLILFWLLFTVSFAVWWLKLLIEHISTLASLQPDLAEHWARQRRMVQAEGGAWLVLLILGGGALILLVQRERLRSGRIREFFASFSHEVKTSLASLRLQAESLKDDLGSSPVLDRLIGDTVRLQIQLENSLFLASQDNLRFYVQPIALSGVVDLLKHQWPSLRIELKRDCVVFGDERAVRTLLSNFMQNAIIHGGASEVVIDPRSDAEGRVRILFRDNGQGFEGDLAELGELFHRPKASSGSGLGLYICRLLLRHMKGDLSLHADNHGFRIDVVMEGKLK